MDEFKTGDIVRITENGAFFNKDFIGMISRVFYSFDSHTYKFIVEFKFPDVNKLSNVVFGISEIILATDREIFLYYLYGSTAMINTE